MLLLFRILFAIRQGIPQTRSCLLKDYKVNVYWIFFISRFKLQNTHIVLVPIFFVKTYIMRRQDIFNCGAHM